jgi:hypothetical protein
MANEALIDLLRQGAEVWNDWRKEHPLEDVDLTYADLAGADLRSAHLMSVNLRDAILSDANLSDADLRDANLRGAILMNANLRYADLSGAEVRDAILSYANLSLADLSYANLRGADLSYANLSLADLRYADLRDADLSYANLSLADLSDANFSGAKLGRTILGYLDLRGVKGLDSCTHSGPSVIDFATLARSGTLPLVFLRGAGLPDNVIDYLPSLLNEPLEFYSCFISYASEDQAFAERLHADLQNKGIRCWFAPHDIQGGKKFHEQIDQAIRVYDKLLLILSAQSIHKPWVEFELRKARKREVQEQRRVLFPVRLIDYAALEGWECFDADTKKDLATEIREYFIPDFSAWQEHNSYQKAFTRLLRDLKAEAEKKATPEG